MNRIFGKGTADAAQAAAFSKKLPYLQMPAFSHKPSSYNGPSY